MTIVADESVDFGIIVRLREKGLSVISILENFGGKSDKEVLMIAFEENCVLITEDKDFGELAYRLKLDHKGILLIRLNDLPREERIVIASETIFKYSEKLKNSFAVLTKHGIRIKK